MRPGGQGVRLREGVQYLQRAHRPHGPGDRADGRRVVQVAPGRGVDQQQVVPYEGAQYVDVPRVEADPHGDVTRDRLPRHGVVPRPALADVVQESGHQEQVGAADPAGEGRGPHGRLDEVAVHRPGVDGVALRAAPYPFPVGQQSCDQAFRLHGLPDRDGRLMRHPAG